MATSKERTQLKRLARTIIVAQGNAFVKELLRDNGGKIGATKKEFEKNLNAAIDEGLLTKEHFQSWLASVEGWGNQHVYLFSAPQDISASLSDAGRIKRKVAGTEYESLIDADSTLAFPKKRQLTSIQCNKTAFQLEWHSGHSRWDRYKDSDYQEERGLDRFEFRAYRERPLRTVMRFVSPPDKDYAAIFLQIPAEDVLHREAIREIWKTVGNVSGIDVPLEPIALGEAIKNRDRQRTKRGALPYPVSTSNSKLVTDGAYVEFGSEIPDRDYKDAPAVEQIHRAVQYDRFQGSHGRFGLKPDKKLPLSREIKMQLYSGDNRIRIWVQCKRDDVLSVLDVIRDCHE